MRRLALGVGAGVMLGALAATGVAQDFGGTPERATTTQNAERAEANEALGAQEYQRALKLLTALVAVSPKDARLRYDLGSAQDALDQSSAAEENYRAAIGYDGTFLEPRVALGLLLARRGQFAEARGALKDGVSLASQDMALRARAFRALARIDQKARPAEARDELLEALKLSPETPEDALLSAELAQAAGNGAGAAEAAYRRVLARVPNDADAAAGLAHLLIASKRPEEAQTLAEAALAVHPQSESLTVELAAAYGAENKLAQAIPLVEALHTKDARNANVAMLLGRLYLDAGDWTQAEALLSLLAKQRPEDAVLQDDYAEALIHLKRSALAQKVLFEVVARPELFPAPDAYGKAAGHLAFAASTNGDPEEALRALAIRARVSPLSAPMLFLLAISHDKLHHVKLAQKAYKQFLEASKGLLPDEEFEARHRLVALDHPH